MYADEQSVMQKLTICHLESFPGIWYNAEQYNHQDFIHRSINIIAAKKLQQAKLCGPIKQHISDKDVWPIFNPKAHGILGNVFSEK